MFEKISKIEEIIYEDEVFNLHIKDNHNYYANGILVSNCHQYKADAIKGIMEKALTTDYRIGMTGTLDNTKCNVSVITGLFGPVKKIITTKELMERNEISSLNIDIIFLKYSDQDRTENKKRDYHEEIDWIISNNKRNVFISKLCTNLKGNTLILSNYIDKHIKPLYDIIKKNNPNRKIFLIHGSVDVEEREMIRKIIEKENDAILIASYGTFSTGANVKRLHNIVFGTPSKSVIRVLQSIGRGLRKGEGKDLAKLFDIADDLSVGKHQNFSLRHALERCKIYDLEKFNYKSININLGD